jgi:predicted TPR repeat methyltransferase
LHPVYLFSLFFNDYLKMYQSDPPSEQQLIDLLNEAYCLHQSGVSGKAEALYRQLLPQLPGCWQLLYNLGLLLHDSGRYDEAADFYDRALHLGIEDGDLYFNLALTCKQRGRLDQAIIYYRKAIDLQPDDIDYLYNLAGCYLTGCRYDEAATAYEAVLQRDPSHLPALNNLAYLSHISGKTEQARELYQLVLVIRPDSPSAEHMLAALSGSPRTTAPPSYIRDIFDHYADHYESSLLADLHYSVPERLANLVTSVAGKSVFASMLDLGCGTGLIGAHFNTRTKLLHGVDISEKMLALAEQKKCYDALYLAEIEQFLSSSTSCYDLLVAADVFPYLGRLEHIFCCGQAVVSDDGYFFFTVEELLGDDRPLLLGSSGRFAHADRFVRSCAGDCGWSVLCSQRIPLRKERDAWVAGIIYGLKKLQA